MSLARWAASLPRGVLPIACLEFSSTAWALPHRRVIQPEAWTVTIDGVATVFPGWNEVGPWLGDFPASDDTGRAERALSLDDPDSSLHGQIEAAIDAGATVVVRLWWFRSDLLTAAAIAEQYTVQASRPADDRLEVDCVTPDLSNITDPYIRHTRSNSPGLRGR